MSHLSVEEELFFFHTILSTSILFFLYIANSRFSIKGFIGSLKIPVRYSDTARYWSPHYCGISQQL